MKLFEYTLKKKGFPLPEAEKEIERLCNLSPAEFDEYREDSKWEIFNYHFKNNSFYREFTGNNKPAKWEEIPIIRKKDFQKPFAEIIPDDQDPGEMYVSNTSGSSGHPFYFAKDKFSHAIAWALIKKLYSLYGITLNSKQARFYGIPFNLKGFIKEKIKDWLSNRLRFPVFDLSDSVLEKWIKRFRKYRFEYLYGYTSSLVYFARYCHSAGINLKDLCPTLKVCIVTSEVCTPEDKTILEKGYGVPVVNEYGASELGIIAFEHPGKGWLISEETVYLEVVDENGIPVPDGQEGKIICTSLFNRGTPLIRYEIGDVGIKMKEGNTTKLVRLLGRVNDFARLPSGKTAPGLTFYYVAKEILENTGAIKEFIIRQTAIDEFHLDMVSERELFPNEEEVIRKEMVKYLEPGLRLKINRVENLERPASGKIKHFYSEID